MSRTIEAISFAPDGVRFSYMDGDVDIRAEGGIYQSHTLCVAWADEPMEDSLRALEELAADVLQEALTRWSKTLPVSLTPDRPEDDDEDDDDDELGGS